MPPKIKSAPIDLSDLDPEMLPAILQADDERKAAAYRLYQAKEEQKAAKEALGEAQEKVFQLIQDARPTPLEQAAEAAGRETP
jgi:predicted GTPase